MSEIDTYYFHGAQRDLDMRKSTGGDWVKRTDHETAMRDLTKVAGECPECEAMVRAAADEEMLSGVVALANGAVVQLRFPEAELELFVEMAADMSCLLRAIVPPDGWTCELLAPGFAPREREEPAVQSIATGPHWAGEGVVRTCGRCGESGLLDVMRCKCVDEGGE